MANRSKTCLTRCLVGGKCVIRNVGHQSSVFGASHVSRLCRSPRIRGHGLVLRCNSLASDLGLAHVVNRVRPSRVCGLTTVDRIGIDFSAPRCATGASNLKILHVLRTIHLLGLVPGAHVCRTSASRLCNLIRRIPRGRAAPFCPEDPCTMTGLCNC